MPRAALRLAALAALLAPFALACGGGVVAEHADGGPRGSGSTTTTPAPGPAPTPTPAPTPPAPRTLATGLTNPAALAVDDTSLYFADVNASVIGKVAKTGGPVITLAANEYAPSAIGVDTTSVYFATLDFVASVPIGGGAVSTICTFPKPDPVGNLVLQGGTAYLSMTSGSVQAVDLAAGTLTTLASSQPAVFSVAVQGPSLYWVSSGGQSGAQAGSLWTVATSGGWSRELAGMLGLPTIVATDDVAIYVGGEGTIARWSVAGGAPTTVAYASDPRGLTVSGAFVYWADSNGGSVWRAPSIGGTPQELAGGQYYPSAIVIDEGHLYWANEGPLDGAEGPKNGSLMVEDL